MQKGIIQLAHIYRDCSMQPDQHGSLLALRLTSDADVALVLVMKVGRLILGKSKQMESRFS